ncbi:MAG: hypothetical protein ACK5CE_04380 [Actinomycetes bacterium]|nr:hypothetical protein [Actinomycetota bacterium]
MKRIALRSTAAIVIIVAAAASTEGVVDAGTAKRPKVPAVSCEQDCPIASTLAGGRGIRW